MGASDYAPYSFRKAAYLDIGGIDESAGEPGQCGILSDWEISSRVWLAGWHLGYTYIFTKLDGGIGGGAAVWCRAVLCCAVLQVPALCDVLAENKIEPCNGKPAAVCTGRRAPSHAAAATASMSHKASAR